MQFSPDGSRVIARAGGGTVCVWEVATGALDKSLDAGRRNSAPWMSFEEEVSISSDGHVLAATERAADGSGEIGLWDLASGRRSSTIPTGSKAVIVLVGFGEADATLIALPDRHTVSVFDTQTGKIRATWSSDPKDSIDPIALSPDRKTLAFGVNRHGPLQIMDLGKGSTRSLELGGAATSMVKASVTQPQSDSVARVESMIFSRDGRTLYAGRFRAVSVVDLEHGVEKPMLTLPSDARSGHLALLSVSSDGTRLLTEMKGFLFPIFDLTTGHVLTHGAPRVSVTRAQVPAFIEGKLGSFDGWGRVVYQGRVAYVALLPQENMRVGGETRQTSSYAWASATSPDGSLLALKLDALNNLTLWDAKTDGWIDLLESTVPYGPSLHLNFSRDGKTLAVTEKGIDIWDIPKRKLRYRLGGV